MLAYHLVAEVDHESCEKAVKHIEKYREKGFMKARGGREMSLLRTGQWRRIAINMTNRIVAYVFQQ
jgi:hypothetical protein